MLLEGEKKMLIAAFLAASIYTVFAPIVAGKKHFFIGVSVLVVLGVLLFATGSMK